MDYAAALAEIRAAAADEGAAVEFVERRRWAGKPYCPTCNGENVYPMTSREGGREKNYRWRCRNKKCKRPMFSVRTGTVMESSRLPLRMWVHAFWRACASKKGVSALQIQRETGLTYKSALFLMHRIRWAMAPANEQESKLGTNGRLPVPSTNMPNGKWKPTRPLAA